jgi:two-component system, NtrC family, response regulator AtoC
MTSDLPPTHRRPERQVVRHELVVMSETSVHVVALPGTGELSVGRAADAAVRIDSADVSRCHAILRVRDGRFSIEDNGSANGCFVHGKRLPSTSAVDIAPGDAVHIGDFVLLVRAVHDARPPIARPPSIAAAGDVVVTSPAMMRIYALADPIAKSDLSVLVLGETGVGKDVFARHLHDQSARAVGAFVRLNCATLSEALLESELFGHVRGAFTGAVADKPGLFESAEGGTAFLDEIGDVSSGIQAKLLQVIETREVQRIGSVRPRAIDVRFIAATNRPLDTDAAAGRFRSDLYYRLAGFTVRIPPLRDRRDEIVPLAEGFVRRIASRMGIAPCAIDAPAAATLRAHGWPGNIRELRNTVERAVVLARGGPITQQLLEIATEPSTPTVAVPVEPELGFSPTELAEREQLMAALIAASGNQSRAARALGISRTRLLNRLEALRIRRPRKGAE